MRFGHRNHPIEAFSAYRSDQAFANGVGKSRQLHAIQLIRQSSSKSLTRSIRYADG
jgi:hypothetical protein